MNGPAPVDPPWAPDHPVLELLRRRRAEGSRPGARTDGQRLALTVEGGGMRGVVSAAMLTAIEDLGFSPGFDAVFGGSSGSLNAAYFLTGGLWRSLAIYYDELATPLFIDLRRPLRGRPVLDVDWAFDGIVDGSVPLDYGAVLRSPVPLHVSVSLVDEVRVEVVSEFSSATDLRAALRAGAWLPVATSGTASFRGRRAVDGGALVSHPSRLALDAGYTRVLSLSTQPPPSAGPHADLLQRYAATRLERLRPGLGPAYMAAHRLGRTDRVRLGRWRRAPGAEPAVLDMCPSARATVTRFEIRSGPLLAAARDAYETMAWALDGRFRRAYPRFTVQSGDDAVTWRSRSS